MKQRVGLTVADLLVIVVVIVVLAAILFPVFARSSRSPIELCRSRLRVVSFSIKDYAADYDGSYPRPAQWCDAIGPRLKHTKFLQCPAARKQRCGYAYSDTMPATLKGVTSSAKTPMLFDAVGDWNTVGGASIAARRHGNGLNIAFADGHTEWVRRLSNPDPTEVTNAAFR